ncbi:Aldo/keto reductase [Hymenopellis radicata]|nr:Aldo/keto reductase [Hymenopellis radicata]
MSGMFVPAPEPPSKLGIYRVLSSRAGIRVSPLQLGAMSIGDQWEKFLGPMDKKTSFDILDAYYEMGGNFIDTANLYQDETSEEFIGEWAENRGIRDQLVIATKYTTNFKRGNDVQQKVNYTGNHSKSLYLSVEASLKKLRTDYIDILYIHWWDYETSVPEAMDSLHHLVASRKVLYLGISDTPAWVVAQANQYAIDHGKTPFVIYQGRWSVLERSFEREIIPMARSFGLALAPFQVLGAGRLRTEAEDKRRRETGESERPAGSGRTTSTKTEIKLASGTRTELEIKLSNALEKVANEIGAKSIQSVAIAYVMQKMPYVFPIIGGRKVEHLKANVEALEITLSKEQIKYLEDCNPLDYGFPVGSLGDGTTYNPFLRSAARLAKQPLLEPIKP